MKTLKVLLQEVVSGIKAWVNSNFAQESNTVHKTGNETVNGDKTLTGTTTFSGNVACGQNCQFTKRVNPYEVTGTSDCNLAFNALNNVVYFNTRGSSNYKGYGSFLWTGYSSDAAPDRYGQIQLLRSTDLYGDTNDGRVPDPTFKMWRVATHYNVMDFMESVRVMNLDSYNYMIPISNNVTDLGTSTNRWKTFNGVNPGELSLPFMGVTASQTIDITDWYIPDPDDPTYPDENAKKIDDSVEHTIEASSHVGAGYIHIAIPNVSGNYVYARQYAMLTNMCDGRVADGLASNVLTNIFFIFPIINALQVRIKAKTAVVRFFPCIGNV